MAHSYRIYFHLEPFATERSNSKNKIVFGYYIPVDGNIIKYAEFDYRSVDECLIFMYYSFDGILFFEIILIFQSKKAITIILLFNRCIKQTNRRSNWFFIYRKNIPFVFNVFFLQFFLYSFRMLDVQNLIHHTI